MAAAMRRPTFAVALALAGCQSVDEPGPTPAAAIVVQHESSGATFTLTRTPTGCGGTVTVAIAGDTASVGTWRLAPGPTGLDLTQDGALALRVVDEAPLRRSYVDATGVPRVHHAFTPHGGSASSAARQQLGTLTRTAPGTFQWIDAGGALDATITGTTDAELALTLASPVLDPAARALVACARLTSLSPAKSP